MERILGMAPSSTMSIMKSELPSLELTRKQRRQDYEHGNERSFWKALG